MDEFYSLTIVELQNKVAALEATCEFLRESLKANDTLAAENARLKEREKLCETMDKAEKLALIRALQEIRDCTSLLGDGVSPSNIVDAVKAMAANSGQWCEPCGTPRGNKCWRHCVTPTGERQ